MSYTIVAHQAVLPGHDAPVPATITVADGKIASVVEGVSGVPNDAVVIPADRVLIPGLIE